jgi:hypothetical protein
MPEWIKEVVADLVEKVRQLITPPQPIPVRVRPRR